MELFLDYEKEYLYVTLGEDCFPEENWVELVDADLERWVPALTSFLAGHTDQCRLEFMDGPFEVRLLCQETGIIARFLQEGREVRPEYAPDREILCRSMIRILRQCRRADYLRGNPLRFDRELAFLQDQKPIRQGEHHV